MLVIQELCINVTIRLILAETLWEILKFYNKKEKKKNGSVKNEECRC
jgi:hypothetical protein